MSVLESDEWDKMALQFYGLRKLIMGIMTMIGLIAMFFAVLAIHPEYITERVLVVYAISLAAVFAILVMGNLVSKIAFSKGTFSAEFNKNGEKDTKTNPVASNGSGSIVSPPMGNMANSQDIPPLEEIGG